MATALSPVAGAMQAPASCRICTPFQSRPRRQPRGLARRNLGPSGSKQVSGRCSAEESGCSGEVSAETSEAEPAAAEAAKPVEVEEVFYEGRGAPAELAVNLLLGATLLYLPLTAQSIGRRAWIGYKFTSKRLVIENTSPLFAKTQQILWKDVREVRSAPRCFGLWGDMVFFLRDGGRLELVGVEDHLKLRGFVEGYIL